MTFPALPPDRLRTIAPVLGITPTCGNPQQVFTRIQKTLPTIGIRYPPHPCIEHWMTIAAALGMPDDHLPIPVHLEITATVCAQWAAPPPNPTPNRVTAEIASLRRGDPIPDGLMTEALRTGDRTAIVTWIAYSAWDDRFTNVCDMLTAEETVTIVRAGAVPDALVERVIQRWTLRTLPWNIFSFTMWDRVTNPKVACEGQARTTAAKPVRAPALRDDRLIAVVADSPRRAARASRSSYRRTPACRHRTRPSISRRRAGAVPRPPRPSDPCGRAGTRWIISMSRARIMEL